MKKIFTLIAMAAMAIGANAQTWNFSEWEAKEFAETFTKDGLTVTATDGAKVTIDGNNKTVDGVSYTQRLKTGGTGGFTEDGIEQRTLKFDVPGDATIDIILCSASSGEDRTLNVYFNAFTAESKDNPSTTVPAVAGSPVKQTVEYKGGATTITLSSAKSGVNIYAIYVTATGGGEQGGGEQGGGSTDSYVAITAEGLAPEFAAVVGEDNVATNVANNNSIVKIELANITLEAVASATPKDVTKDAITSWNDVKWEKKNQGDINFDYILGTGVCYTSWEYEEIVRDGEPTGEYRMLIGNDDNGWPNFYVTDGSHGLPISGLYFKYTPKVNGTLKMGIWMNKGNRRLFVVPSDTKVAIDYQVEGYINGQNDEDGKKKYLTNDEIRALSTDPYVMGAGNQPFWGYVTVGLEAGKDYYIFSQNAQVGFQGFEFTTGGTDGIENVQVMKVQNNKIYNLQGQVVGDDYKGIVIKNGKKFLKK